jgi:hypothetical protein
MNTESVWRWWDLPAYDQGHPHAGGAVAHRPRRRSAPHPAKPDRHLLDSIPYKKVGMDLPKIPRDISIAPSRAGSLIPLKAASCRLQALYLLVNRFSFLLKPRDLRFWHIGAAQLIEHFADGEFVYFSHGKILFA